MNDPKSMKPKKNHKIIYSLKLAGYLMYHGCRLIRTEPDIENPRLNNFVFYDDEKVDKYMKQFYYEEETAKNEKQNLHNRENRRTVQGMAQ